VAAEPSPDDLAREVAELRAAVAALAEIARDVDMRAVALERRVLAIAAASPAVALAPAPAATGQDTAARVVSLAVGAPPEATRPPAARPVERRGRHRSRDPEVVAKERAADRRGVLVSAVMMLPWLLCIGLFAIALGLVAVSTFQ
jgi:hypothetical protein